MEFEMIDLFTLVGVALVAILTVLNRRGNDTLTVEGVTEGIQTAGDIWEDANEIVQGIEQMWQTGQIDKDNRINLGIAALRDLHPELDERVLRLAIESGVALLKRWQAS